MKTLLKDDQGRWRTRSIFFETSEPGLREQYPPLYTLKDEPHTIYGVTYPSARQIYLEERDLTEYSAAMKLLGSWRHWKWLCSVQWFQEYIQEWRDELEVILRSEAIRGIAKDASSESRTRITSAKWMAEKGWAKDDKRGRPSKKKIEKEAKIHNRIAEELDDDIERMSKH